MTFEDTKQNISPPKDSNYFRKFHLSLGEYIIHMKECSKMAVIHFYLYRLMQKLLLFESLISGFEILSCQKKGTNKPIGPLQRIHRQSITKVSRN